MPAEEKNEEYNSKLILNIGYDMTHIRLHATVLYAVFDKNITTVFKKVIFPL